jgi:dolichyl-phosphate-mannose--protein O-mannosyl transferase
MTTQSWWLKFIALLAVTIAVTGLIVWADDQLKKRKQLQQRTVFRGIVGFMLHWLTFLFRFVQFLHSSGGYFQI